ncbi:MAG: SpoIIE family protein phosphatase [Bryobacteraceae bacterium]|jgi:serine phosphatase RsbU (regulator of sigma subunit)
MPGGLRADEPERTAGLVVVNPSGTRTRVAIEPLPFLIGRQSDNHLVLRDNRASRLHARITAEGGCWYVEDLNSRHGVYVNGQRVEKQRLSTSDRIEFGFADSYKLIFSLEEDELERLLEQISAPALPAVAGSGGLGKLRALVEVARALQTSLSIDDVLTSVVDAAMAITATERGFLLLRDKGDLRVSVARDRFGAPLSDSDLQVPTSVIHRALSTRRELLTMNFDPLEQQGVRPSMSVSDLELRSVVCVPLLRVRAGSVQETMLASLSDTVGLLYMDSRQAHADLSGGNRELLQTLALEASTILENARLLEEEREKQRMEEELNVARKIQNDLLPRELPSSGWFRAAGSSIPSREVGGDYYDLRQTAPDTWTTVVADVSGKGVSSALLAALLQGAFLLGGEATLPIEHMMSRMNHFLNARTMGEKYATAFYCTLQKDGTLRWVNAGHPRPYLIRRNGELARLASTGLPMGMLDDATYEALEERLGPGDRVVLFSDGLSEAENAEGEFFDKAGLPLVIGEHLGSGCEELRSALERAVVEFVASPLPADDVTIVVIEYAG